MSDVAIIGTGVAGLAAAAALSSRGLRVTVVEARERIGGRILSLHPPEVGAAIELGAEFVHGRPPELLRLLEEADANLVETAGVDACYSHGRLSKCGDDARMDLLDELEKTVERRGDMSFDAFLAHRHASPKASESARSYVEGFNAADAGRIGIAALARQQHAEGEIEGDRSWRVPGGYDVLPQYLARQARESGARILLSSPVASVHWSAGGVELEYGDGQRLAATRAIVTLPLGVLQARSVVFDPEPLEVYSTADRMAAGAVQRVVLIFRTRFWAEAMPEMRFLFGEGTPATWWTQHPLETPILVGWIGGPRALAEEVSDAPRLLDCALRSLERMFAMPSQSLGAHLIGWHLHDWQKDPFSLGAYSYAPAGAVDCSAMMAIPVENTLFFAGEHTDVTGHWGTVHGALRSGLRAARQVLAGWA